MESDPFHLERFLKAQAVCYDTALAELREGRKHSHWMWFIFPQLAGLGLSSTAQFYAISGADEARAYLAHPILGERLQDCSAALLTVQGKTAYEILGSPDDLKLHSSMTLFDKVAVAETVFAKVLERYYESLPDERTVELLG